MNPKTIDRGLVALNVILIAAVIFFLMKPGGVLHRTLEKLLVERRAKAFLARDWNKLTSGAPTLAGDSTNVAVILFSDYECPFCRAAYPHIQSINKGRLGAGIALRHLTPSSHPNAHRAAAAAICAAEQGQFQAMSALLFTARLDSLSLEWGRAAASSGVPDVGKFLHCMADSGTVAQVSADSALAAVLGINATPTFVTKSGRFPGVKSPAELLALLGESNVAP